MQDLDLAIRIAEIILFLALTFLCIYLVISLKKITGAVNNIQNNVDHLQKKVEPLIENVTAVTNDVQVISTSVKGQIDKVSGVVDTVKETIDNVKETTDSIIKFEQKTQKEVELQVGDALNFISAVVTGAKKFVSVLSGNNNHVPKRKSYYSSVTDNDYDDE